MDLHSAPLQTRADLERALDEARRLLPGLEQAGPAEAARFQALLQRIAAYRGPDALAHPDPDRERLQALDSHLQAYGRRWSPGDGARTSPWSAMLGGDVNPRRKRD
jgi:hypothetical protein